ncbi:MAG: transcription elongation factor GreA [Nitrospira sp.]|nr:transcription elongation factor GreA [Nitrospira sp.]MCB9711081.1 transcription elongation factor GreA [Nitrospiraceae bacterium]MDR4488362.1 transcription elongation factor GreA [Nitrospirales bacterium]MCA9467478.1 transcription elongation factor GreA [Nitrospira sp.]MCA9474910.1 transcription elongation factor GreA [Nitrospira sp.]
MKIPMTKKGFEALQAELTRLRRDERPKVIQAILEAREHGDLKENAEYKAAKEHQQFIDTRMAELEYKLGEAQIVESAAGPSDTVVFGTTVVMLNLETQEEKRYTLVGQEEADLKNGTISVQSPLGRALIGHRVGDVVEVHRPAGMIEYQIQSITIEEA